MEDYTGIDQVLAEDLSEDISDSLMIDDYGPIIDFLDDDSHGDLIDSLIDDEDEEE